MKSPILILRESVKAVPAVKYALGIAGLVSVVAIVRSFGLDYRVAAIGPGILLVLMSTLVVFARLAGLASRDLRRPALVLTWFSLGLVIAGSAVLFSSVVFGRPFSLPRFLANSAEVGEKREVVQLRKSSPVSSPMLGSIVWKSDPGDYIGGGKPAVLTNSDGKLSASSNGNSVAVTFRGDDTWTLWFEAPEGHALTEGFYEPAQRALFQNPLRPGLAIFGAGRGSNTLTGRFVVRKLERLSTGQLVRFQADFEQHNEGGAPALRGTVDLVAPAQFAAIH